MCPLKRPLSDTITPIELSDDGMRFVRSGKIKDGSDAGEAHFAVFENPMLVAQAIATKKLHGMIRESNIRKFSDPL